MALDLRRTMCWHQQASTTATITAKPITVTGLVVVDKEYDGSTTATVDSSGVDWAAVGVLPGDVIGLTASATFPSSHAVGVQTLPLSSTYSGADAGNYDITDQVSATATINAKTVTISGFTVSDRVYDGTTAVLVDPAGLTVNGLVQGETLTVSGGAAAFDSPNAGSRTVTFSGFSLADGGTGLAADYVLDANSLTLTTAASITPKPVTVSFVIADKEYDQTTTATITGSALDGLVGSETLVVTGASGTFANKNVATGKAVTVTGYQLGDDTGLASNYELSSASVVGTAAITPKSLTVSGVTAADKIYDGTVRRSRQHCGDHQWLVGW